MQIGIVAESAAGETRVAATPSTAAQLIKLGYQVAVAAGAGALASFPDADYAAAGATVVPPEEAWSADVVLTVNAPSDAELARLRPGATLVSWLSPGLHPELVERLAALPITALAVDAVPRISRAQSMDVLSSTANIAGYRAVIEAANEFGRFFTGQVTAAGKVPPAKVLVAGAGVAGLAAIGAASSLGAIVRATDPRPEVADQVRSIGGSYLAVEVEVEQSTDGYAKATSEAYDRRAAELYSEQARDVDIIITTANIPGRKAPVLITAADVASMRSGSVIVDLAAANGGNVEGTVPGERAVTANGVIIIGYTDLAARRPARPARRPRPRRGPPGRGPRPWLRVLLAAIGGAVLLAGIAFAPAPLPQHLTVFALAVAVGFLVIGAVHHALHTPLMSVTNAISGVVVVGALLQLATPDWTVKALAFVAVLLVSINIFGGFAVTRRMLAMFRKAER